jgi:hypothetical protein
LLKILNDDPNEEKDRKLKVDPRNTDPRTLTLDPKRPIDRTENVEPNSSCDNTDNDFEIVRELAIESDDPALVILLMDIEEPKANWQKADILDPNLTLLLTETQEANMVLSNIEKSPPI